MNLEMDARNAMADAFAELFATGSVLEFRTVGNDEVATITLNSTPFGSASSGAITAGATTPDGDAVGGVIDHAVLIDASEAVIATLTVGTSAADIVITTLTIAAGATVSLSSLVLTVAAS